MKLTFDQWFEGVCQIYTDEFWQDLRQNLEPNEYDFCSDYKAGLTPRESLDNFLGREVE